VTRNDGALAGPGLAQVRWRASGTRMAIGVPARSRGPGPRNAVAITRGGPEAWC
jgi:hypothetical protein